MSEDSDSNRVPAGDAVPAMTLVRAPRFVSAAVGLLIFIGVVAALARYLLPHEFHMTVARPLYRDFADGQLPVEAAHPLPEALHRLGGAIYLLLGAMQFMPGLRAQRPMLHRVSGRVFIGLGLLAAASAVYMSFAFPYSSTEMAPTVVFATVLSYSALRALAHIRRREVQAHREWMTRAYAVGLGVSTVRILGVGASYATGISVRDLIGPSFWAGFTLTLVGAELWIRAQRAPRAASAAEVTASAASR